MGVPGKKPTTLFLGADLPASGETIRRIAATELEVHAAAAEVNHGKVFEALVQGEETAPEAGRP
jgi:hypothetical protein